MPKYKPHPHLPERAIAKCNNVVIHETAEIDQCRRTTIGSWTVICRKVVIYGHIHDPLDWQLQQDYYLVGAAGACVRAAEPLYIGQHVWIGAHTIILPQVSQICDEVVIGAGSVVTKNIVEPGVYGGNPCKFIKPLPGHQQQEKMYYME